MTRSVAGEFQFFDAVYKKPVLIPAGIIISSAAILVLNAYGLEHGITYVLPHLFYLPIILTAYYYPRAGVLFAVILSAAYCAVSFSLVIPTTVELVSALARAGVFIIIAAVVSYLSGRMHHDTLMCRRLVSVVRSSGDAIIGETPDGIVTDWNYGAEQLLGFTSGEMVGTSIFRVVPAERTDEKHLLLERIARGESIERTETVRITKNGTRIHLSLSSSPIYNQVGDIIGVSEIAHDISERKHAEEALALAGKKLKLLSSITRHDIRNQLMALNAYIQLSENSLDTPEAIRQYLLKEQKIANSIERQISFTRDYEELGVKSAAWYDVSALIRDAGIALPVQDIRLDIRCPGLELFADPLVEKVFYNLIDNSLRYGGEKMTTIRVSMSRQDGDLHLVYEDDGNGVSADDKPQLFTRGFGKHTGLGLFLTREILGITAITIAENGEPGRGARFEMVVPEGAFRVGQGTVTLGQPS
jgi:PAS domain S-box-containing protein